MIQLRTAAKFAAAIATLLLANCANQKPSAQTTKDGKFVNPYPAGTYDNFKAEPTYPKTYSVWKNEELLSKTDASNSSILISLEKQRGFLMNGDQVVMDYPICSGIPERPTPTGTFYILEKVVDKKSNKYGKMLDASGEVVNSNADMGIDPVPEGGRFEGASMRYWMRLTNDGVGHHIGPVKRHPASHACIRGPSATMPVVYSKVKEGTRVTVE
ncbi:MAG: L,D-transpeptidase [Luteolibacter sp.]|uniref:L,D-transpeptidase n=1 Tax=Luteolibacter sp. TaxID=1962973 RepID=UPI003264DE53